MTETKRRYYLRQDNRRALYSADIAEKTQAVSSLDANLSARPCSSVAK